jgi:periplasmic protein TonB
MEKIGRKENFRFILAFSFVAVVFLSNPFQANAQTGNDNALVAAQEMPSFPGGDKALIAALYKNLKYPDQAYENNIEGKVLVRFVISKDGSVTNPTITRSADPDLDRAAIDAIRKLPRFNPGKQDGRPVDVWYSLPIVFKKAQ